MRTTTAVVARGYDRHAGVHWGHDRDRSAIDCDGPPALQAPNAQQVLAERLARGEIEPDDYRARLEVLTTTRT